MKRGHRRQSKHTHRDLLRLFVIEDSLPRRASFPLCGKLVRLLHAFTLTSQVPNLFLHIHIVDLLSSCLLGRNLDHFSHQGATLLGVSKGLEVEDLKFPVLLDKSDDENRFVGEWGPVEGRERR